MPPTSAWCAREAVEEAQRSAAVDTGVTTVIRAGACRRVRRVQQEPVRRLQVVREAASTALTLAPMSPGARACAAHWGRGSRRRRTAHRSSRAVLMFTELAVWRSTTPICSATCDEEPPNTSRRSGSGRPVASCTARAAFGLRRSSRPPGCTVAVQPGAIHAVEPDSHSRAGPATVVSGASSSRRCSGTTSWLPLVHTGVVATVDAVPDALRTSVWTRAGRGSQRAPLPRRTRSPRPAVLRPPCSRTDGGAPRGTRRAARPPACQRSSSAGPIPWRAAARRMQFDRLAADSLSLQFATGGPLQVRERGRRGGVTAAVERPLEAAPPMQRRRARPMPKARAPGQRVQQQ